MSIWDAAGHIEYHMTHGMFLGGRYSIVTVVYDLKKEDALKVSVIIEEKKYSSTNIRRVSERIEETIAYRFKSWLIHLARSMICHRLILYRDHFDHRLITENHIKTCATLIGRFSSFWQEIPRYGSHFPQGKKKAKYRFVFPKFRVFAKIMWKCAYISIFLYLLLLKWPLIQMGPNQVWAPPHGQLTCQRLSSNVHSFSESWGNVHYFIWCYSFWVQWEIEIGN